MTGRTAYIVADNIISPLGTDSAENYRRVLAGESALRLHSGAAIGVAEDYQASIMEEDCLEDGKIQGAYTPFESRLILSVSKALSQVEWIDPASEKVLFIVSSTKGNIGGFLGDSARKVASAFGNKVRPLVVSNACISGLCAQIEAMRALRSSRFDHVVVCGTDIQSKFIVSGFQSFKALSGRACRPFDSVRDGLNLGEAAATMIYSAALPEGYAPVQGRKIWVARRGAIRNDANHISGPSRTGEGSYRALRAALGDFPVSGLAFVNPHGTATLYNDEMESIAITRAGLGAVPVAGYKGYYGHTMGAAGLVETILSMKAVENHMIPGTRGYSENGVSCPLDISPSPRPTYKDSFVKLLSGFGGCNAAALFTLSDAPSSPSWTSVPAASDAAPRLEYLHRVHITPRSVELDGVRLEAEGMGEAFLSDIYRRRIGDYPKFYKMDPLCKLGFVASELLASAEGRLPEGREDRAVILFNRSASLADDRIYLDTISDGNYFPSPKVFVYTLPNIVTGEISIRNKYYGETSFYVLDERDEDVMVNVISQALSDRGTASVLGGWCECSSPDGFEADMFICKAL